ncbi:hypothetical protein MHZ36_09620 [Staphylococcus sp. ACRSN]|uniref:DNA damage-induced cell division inhibitor SosA n=1 Tax=Staphylococcus sp. ACRSN TaxID=2918214 RepID=UPI001EF28C3B|nr:DNA damage-induced cell division inhibitor SosA [Staphylococcus sp. ACRSN]MCG7339550.1 hypothetical protein [Staphylococcus sp. ACRSN]
MIKIYKSHIKTYLTVLIATMVLCSLFILTANHNSGAEQTYEMTDHQVAKHVQHQKDNNDVKDVDTEQSEHQVTPLVASVN